MSGQQHEVTFRFLAQPTDVNFGGKVHGGMAMKWIDQAGYACAVGWSGAYCVTASVSGIQFVALDSPDGKPTPVLRWEPRDENERRLQAQAKQLLELSKGMEQLVDLRAASLG